MWFPWGGSLGLPLPSAVSHAPEEVCVLRTGGLLDGSTLERAIKEVGPPAPGELSDGPKPLLIERNLIRVLGPEPPS